MVCLKKGKERCDDCLKPSKALVSIKQRYAMQETMKKSKPKVWNTFLAQRELLNYGTSS